MKRRYYINYDPRIGDMIAISERELINIIRKRGYTDESDREALLHAVIYYEVKPIPGCRIEDLEVGDYVTDGRSICSVKRCEHNNFYYAFEGKIEDVKHLDIDVLHVVLDMDENKVECCS